MNGKLTWDPYFLASGSHVSDFWKALSAARPRKVLYIGGRGFDPRTNLGVTTLIQAGFKGSCDCLCLNMTGFGGAEASDLVKLSDANHESLLSITSGFGTVRVVEIQAWSGETDAMARTGPDQALRLANEDLLQGYSDVVLDLSALPKGIYFPLISRLVQLCRKECSNISLYVFVAEDPALDRRIEEAGLDEDAYFVPPFRSAMELQSDSPLIWFPLLGENQKPQVEMVQTLVRSKAENVEVCPVLPLPARDPRRADCLIREFSEFLASGWENDSRSFVYVSEQNPFQAYRHLVQSARQYNDALYSVGGCRTVISAHSSKLLSLGATLAALELQFSGMRVGLANVDATAYRVNPPSDAPFENTGVVPFLISLSGEPYAD